MIPKLKELDEQTAALIKYKKIISEIQDAMKGYELNDSRDDWKILQEIEEILKTNLSSNKEFKDCPKCGYYIPRNEKCPYCEGRKESLSKEIKPTQPVNWRKAYLNAMEAKAKLKKAISQIRDVLNKSIYVKDSIEHRFIKRIREILKTLNLSSKESLSKETKSGLYIKHKGKYVPCRGLDEETLAKEQ